MPSPRAAFYLTVVCAVSACKHPLAIHGQGDIFERLVGQRGCTLEEFEAGGARCAENEVVDEAYQVRYEAVARSGWRFAGWEGTACAETSIRPFCEYNVSADWVSFTNLTWPDIAMPPTRAVFSELGTQGEFRIDDGTGIEQRAPSSAALPGGEFVVSWVSTVPIPTEMTLEDNPSKDVIYARLFDRNGQPSATAFEVNSDTVGSHKRPVVSTLVGGGFVIAWEAFDENFEADVFARRFDDGGSALGPEFRVNSNSEGSQGRPDVAALGSNGFIVVWDSISFDGISQDGDESGVFAQRFSADGEAIGLEFQVNTTTELEQESASIAGFSDGGFIIAWNDGFCCQLGDGRDGSGTGIFAQRYGSDGSRAGEEFQVNSTVLLDQFFPTVAVSANDDFLVTWDADDDFPDPFGDPRADVYGQLFDTGGSRIGEEFKVNTESVGEQSQGSHGSTALANGHYLIVWDSDGDGPANTHGRIYDGTGSLSKDDFTINQTDGNTATSRPTLLANGSFLVTWVLDGKGWGRLFNEQGTPY